MEEKKKTVPRYRQIIEEEGLMKYMSKVGVTSRQKYVLRSYMKGISEGQLAKKYNVAVNTIHEDIRSYVGSARKYVGDSPALRKIKWYESVKPDEDLMKNVISNKNTKRYATYKALIESTRVAAKKADMLLDAKRRNPKKIKELEGYIRTALETSEKILEMVEEEDKDLE